MNREEAQHAIGRPFSIWTAANGCYVGTLNDVVVAPRKPWRAQLTITAVLDVACHAEHGRSCRKGFRPGDPIEVGGINIKPLEGDATGRGTDYLTALRRAHARMEDSLARDPHGPYAWASHMALKGYAWAIAAEEGRLAGQPWPANQALARYEPPAEPVTTASRGP
jgi:hypothetical protein